MSQQELFNFLEKHPDQWFTAKEINEYLHLSQGSVSNNLKKLRLRNSVDYKKLEKRGYIYKFKENQQE